MINKQRRQPMFICQYCQSERSTKQSHIQHERTCPQNSGRIYKNGMTGKVGGNQYTTAAKSGLPIPKYDTTHRPRVGVAALTKEQRSAYAKSQGFGGYRENAGRTKKFKVVDSFGKETVLQSTYELKCSRLLDELQIRWKRPTALKYDGRNYYADFYLVDADIYLDPKNSYKAKLDAEKIQKVVDQNLVRVYILLEEQITAEYLTMLVSPNGEGLA